MRHALRILLPGIVLLVFSAGPAQAGSDRLKLNLAAWPASLSGVEQINGNLVGTSIDLEETLGVQDEIFPEVHLSLKLLGPMRLIASYYTTEYDGKETLTQSITFNDTTFSASEEVRSNLDLSVARVLLSFHPVNFKRVNLGLMIGADLMKVDSTLSSSLTGTRQKDFTAPVPVVGANLTLQPIDKLAIYAEVSGLSIDVGDVEASILDAIFRVEYYFMPWFAVTGGYRLFDFDITESDFGRVNFKQDGFQMGLAFRL
ncbi:MAG: hypothetical protein V3U98_00955 [Acidobacteriota bacterium]